MKKIPILVPRDLVLWHAYNPAYQAAYEKIKNVIAPRKLWAAQEDMPPFPFPRKESEAEAWGKTEREALSRFQDAWPALALPFPPDIARRDPDFFKDHLAPAVVPVNNPLREKDWGKKPMRGTDGRHPNAEFRWTLPIFDADLVGGRFLRLEVDLSKPWPGVEKEIRFAFTAAKRAFLPKERAVAAPRRVWDVLKKAEEISTKDPYKIAAALEPELHAKKDMVSVRKKRALRDEVWRCLEWAKETGTGPE